jgi:hypothetical protein
VSLNEFSLIQKYTNGRCFIDFEKINILNDNDVKYGVIPIINFESGLLETPRREDTYLSAKVIFSPDINLLPKKNKIANPCMYY